MPHTNKQTASYNLYMTNIHLNSAGSIWTQKMAHSYVIHSEEREHTDIS